MRDGNIWTINPATREQSRLIVDGSQPAWSANGQRLLFVRGGTIWVAHADGSDQVRLTTASDGAAGSPAWSPDGTRIAFETRGGISTMRGDGTGWEQLVDEGHDPTWSPDGRRVAFQLGDSLWTVASSGEDPRRIASEYFSGDLESGVEYPWWPRSLDWSPDGRQIAAEYGYTGSGPAYLLLRVPAGGGAPSRFSPSYLGGAPSWSPDGRHLVISEALALIVIDVTGGSRNLTSPGGFFDYGAPAWQPLPPPRPSDDTPPFVAWVKPRSGEVISGILSEARGSCLVEANDPSGIARTENYVDGQFHDRQVSAPWSCEIDTRTLSNGPHTLKVRAYDRAGNFAEASAHVTVRNGGSGPATQPTSNPGGGGPPGSPESPSGTTNPPSTTGSGARVTAKQARRGIVRALTRRQRSFRQRRGHTIRCKASANGTTQTCTTRWKTRSKAYTARIRVRRGASGLVVRVLSLRVKIRS